MLATDRINVFPLNNVPGTIVTLMDTCDAVLARRPIWYLLLGLSDQPALKGDDDLLPLNGWKGERQIIVGQWQGGAPRSGPRVGIQAKSWLQQPNASQIKSLRYLRPSKSAASGNTAV